MSDLKDFLEFRGLDLGSGQRGVDLLKDFKTAEDLGEEYGYDVALPSLGGLPVNQFALQNRDKLLGEGKKTISYGGKEFITDKDMPTGLPRLAAGIADIFQPGKDRDKRGQIKLNPFAMASEENIGLKEFNPNLAGLQLTPSQQRKAAKSYREEMAGAGTPVDTLDDAMKEFFDYKKKSDTQSRKGRVLDNALDFLSLRLQTPFMMNTLKDASTFKQQQLLDAEAIKQGLPNAVQARALAAGADFAQQAQAIAAQQDAATRFAGLGMQRPFGQPTFRVS